MPCGRWWRLNLRSCIGLAFVALLLAVVAGSAEAQGKPLPGLHSAPPDHASARGPPAHVALPETARHVRDAGAATDAPPARDLTDAAPLRTPPPRPTQPLPLPAADAVELRDVPEVIVQAAPTVADAGEQLAPAPAVVASPPPPPPDDIIPEIQTPVAAAPSASMRLPPLVRETTPPPPSPPTAEHASADLANDAPPDDSLPEVVDALMGEAPDESAAAGATSPLAMPVVGPLVRVLPVLALVGAASLALAVRMRAPSVLVRVQRERPMTPIVPGDADGALRNGHAAIERGDLAEALAWFDHASRARPRLGIAHFCRGIALGGLGRTPEAHDALAEAVLHAPHEWSYRVHYARCAVALGKTAEAMDALGPVARALPEMHEPMLEDPQLAPLRDHPRFLAMLGRL